MSEKLEREMADFDLAFVCEDCKYFAAEEEKCTIYYPEYLHKRSTIEALGHGDRLYFCKMFESDR